MFFIHPTDFIHPWLSVLERRLLARQLQPPTRTSDTPYMFGLIRFSSTSDLKRIVVMCMSIMFKKRIVDVAVMFVCLYMFEKKK